jgi:hypothetical protein
LPVQKASNPFHPPRLPVTNYMLTPTHPVLPPADLVRVQLVSKRFLPLAREQKLWKALCYDEAPHPPTFSSLPFHNIQPRSPTGVGGSWSTLDISRVVPGLGGPSATPPSSDNESIEPKKEQKGAVNREESFWDKRAREISQWDPGYENEEVDWYSEYIARHSQLSMSWLEQPVDGVGNGKYGVEIRGVGYLNDANGKSEDLVVGPLEDGSLAVWDLRLSSRKTRYVPDQRGRMIGRSDKGLLFGDTGDALSTSPGFVGVDECVSVDSVRKRVYVAVHNTLNEVDIETMQVVSQERYPWFISALSDATYPTPLTVGTTLSLHLHDPRQNSNSSSGAALSSTTERLEMFSTRAQATLPSPPQSDFHRLFSGEAMPEYASLFQPNPLSILHLPSPTEPTILSDDILVAGRFPSILHYDRRSFPRLTHTLYSGARLSSISSLPYAPRLPMQPPGVFTSAESPTSTLIAAGEYNGRGSLEIYTFPPNPISSAFPRQSLHSPTTPPPSPPPLSNFKNRQTTSSSKLLSCVPHGTRILFSDAEGTLKWVERDGRTLVRRWNINHFDQSNPQSKNSLRRNSASRTTSRSNPHHPPTPRPFDWDTTDYNSRIRSSRPVKFGPVGTDVVRKIIPTNGNLDGDRLLLWTGEKVAVMGFKGKPEWCWDELNELDGDLDKNKRKAVYEDLMRRALERQADEVRWMGRLGLGS